MCDRFTGAEEALDDAQLHALADLSIVNELDVAEHSEEFGRYGDYFRRRTDSSSAVLSPAVAADALAVFG